MRKISIYVEGKSDILFIGQLLTKYYRFIFDYKNINELKANSCNNPEIEISIGSIDTKSNDGGIDCKKLEDLFEEIEKVNEITGIESIIIIDADTEAHKNPKGGFKNRKEYLESLIGTKRIKYFIFPNNSDDGSLEDLLDKLISEKGKAFHSCLSKYICCLSKLEDNDKPKEILENPNLKKKKNEWYSYMMHGKEYKDKCNDYLNDIWNLDCNSLDPLKIFLGNL